ncbi:LPS export ABC transporter periplasmic protein LptC [Oecophyllibacter saccharovorans]|uniref:LPS export ABC transporter periplasmic protein LptC n=1 Tax=Oecophyllibacter saccharovorans TaxID=2558360 RepID=A0A506UQ76_9PROT|nr:LPS export ABC transporter periplasmic protein LptC [Oecophyllibacter saccharovorans]TPW35459.1 LPS export ABC transporter periplasmic protein LptC [Oecophyllibacter saccharovorans]
MSNDSPHSPEQPSDTPATPGAQREDFDPDRQAQLDRLNAHRQAAFQRVRKAPSKDEIARRRLRLNRAKWILPTVAGIFLVSIAAWPEITHLLHQNRAILHELSKVQLESGHMDRAVYHDLDRQGRPYMLTADVAHQIDDDRIDLDHPQADLLLHPNEWVYVRADRGVYMQHEQTLDLDGHVVLYRSDGVLLNTPTADLDLKQGIAATHDWVHAEGPFGTQDAQGAFLDQNANLIQFMGPGRTVHNNDIAPTDGPAGSSLTMPGAASSAGRPKQP